MNSKLHTPAGQLARVKHALVTANTRVERQSRKIVHLETDNTRLVNLLRQHNIDPGMVPHG